MTRRLAVISMHTSPLTQPGSGDGGGLNVYVLETGRRLAVRGYAVDVFTRRTDADAPDTVRVADGFNVHHVTAGPRAPLAKEELHAHTDAFALGVLNHRGSRRYDAVHSHYWLSGWAARRVSRRWDAPLVHTFHTIGLVKNETLAPGDVPEPQARLSAESRLALEVDRIVVSACDEARLVHRRFGVSGSRIDVVRPGVDPAVFHPARTRGEADTVAPDDEAPLLLFVGRLQPLKAPEIAVATLARVRQEFTDARLVVVGGPSGVGTRPDDLLRLAARLGVGDAVTIVPPRPQRDLADLYRSADVVVVPSRSESFGLVALEARACGTPVVAADVGGLRVAVGRGGTLVGSHDPAAFAGAVLPYLRDPSLRARVGTAGAAEAREWTWDRTAEALADVYESVLRPQQLRGAG